MINKLKIGSLVNHKTLPNSLGIVMSEPFEHDHAIAVTVYWIKFDYRCFAFLKDKPKDSYIKFLEIIS